MPNINAGTKTTSIQLKEGAAPTAPASGYGRLWVDTSGVFKFTNDVGVTLSLVDALTAAGLGTATGISSIQMLESASPGTPASGRGRLWVDTSGVLNFTNDGGTTVQLGATTGVAKIAVGTYTGNGADNRNITGVGFTPKFVWVESIGVAGGTFRFGVAGDNAGIHVNSWETWRANYIQSFSSDGFQIGSGTYVNTNTESYTWVAIG